VTAVSTAKEAWDALKDIIEARSSARLLQLMHELSNLKKDGDENIIKYTFRAKGLRRELAMLGNQRDENALVLQIIAGLPAEYDMIKTVLENMDGKKNLSEVSAKLLTVEQRASRGRSSSSTGVNTQAFAALAPKKPWDKKTVVCYSCDKKGLTKSDCLKKKADEDNAFPASSLHYNEHQVRVGSHRSRWALDGVVARFSILHDADRGLYLLHLGDAHQDEGNGTRRHQGPHYAA